MIIKFFFLLWLRTGSNPADINQFRSHIGKSFIRWRYLIRCELVGTESQSQHFLFVYYDGDIKLSPIGLSIKI